ncbi:MAG: DUF1634 domain-containing protein [Clostridiales Family XIII bacterium]|jgi:uncharacterized membrane protein|nr:DUF1634 domain-containing protein [Clostridiales Family XIII bacterium]
MEQNSYSERELENTIEKRIGLILRFGVGAALIVIILGIILLLANGGAGGYGVDSHGDNIWPTTVSAIGAGIISLKPSAILMLGLGLLVATPFIRVAASIYAYLRIKDVMYTVITSVVFIILIATVIFGNIA